MIPSPRIGFLARPLMAADNEISNFSALRNFLKILAAQDCPKHLSSSRGERKLIDERARNDPLSTKSGFAEFASLNHYSLCTIARARNLGG